MPRPHRGEGEAGAAVMAVAAAMGEEGGVACDCRKVFWAVPAAAGVWHREMPTHVGCSELSARAEGGQHPGKHARKGSIHVALRCPAGQRPSMRFPYHGLTGQDM